MGKAVTFSVEKNTSKHLTVLVSMNSAGASAKVRFPVDEMNDPNWNKPYVIMNHTSCEDKSICEAAEKLYTLHLI